MARKGEYKSRHVPSVQFHREIQRTVVDPYVDQILRAFFEAREESHTYDDAHEIPPRNAITDLDWTAGSENRVELKYVYNVVMAEARKRDGKIRHVAYTLTFDRGLAPERCEETGTYYGSMTLAGTPILYYVCLDLADILSEVRTHVSRDSQ